MNLLFRLRVLRLLQREGDLFTQPGGNSLFLNDNAYESVFIRWDIYLLRTQCVFDCNWWRRLLDDSLQIYPSLYGFMTRVYLATKYKHTMIFFAVCGVGTDSFSRNTCLNYTKKCFRSAICSTYYFLYFLNLPSFACCCPIVGSPHCTLCSIYLWKILWYWRPSAWFAWKERK